MWVTPADAESESSNDTNTLQWLIDTESECDSDNNQSHGESQTDKVTNSDQTPIYWLTDNWVTHDSASVTQWHTESVGALRHWRASYWQWWVTVSVTVSVTHSVVGDGNANLKTRNVSTD